MLHENGRIKHVDTIPGMGIGEIKENEGGGEFKYDIRTFLNVSVSPVQ
jgi:hypothetical protein